MSNYKNHEEEYITLKDIFLAIQAYFIEVLSHKWKLIAVGIIIGFILAFKTYMEPPLYREKLTFMMDEKSGEAVEGLNLLSGLFGAGQTSENLSRILDLFESKKIIHNTLFDSIEIKGNKDFLANHFFAEYGIDQLVKDYKRFGLFYKANWPKRLLENTDFKFTHKNIENFTDIENLYLRLLYEKVNGNSNIDMPRLLASSLDDNSGIMTIKMVSEREEITLGVLNNIYNHLSAFFIEKSTEKQTKTYNIIREKRDSVLIALKASEYQLADFKDSNRKLVTVKGYLKQLRLERDVQILNVMYAESVKQMEATDFALKNKTPVVQIIDLPQRPIIEQIGSPISKFVFGFLFGAVLLAIYYVLRKFVLGILEGE